MGRDYSYLALLKTQSGLRLIRVTCLDAAKGSTETEHAATEIRSSSLFIRVTVFADAMCDFSFSRDGKTFDSLGQGFKAKSGIWIGAKVGVFAIGSADASRADTPIMTGSGSRLLHDLHELPRAFSDQVLLPFANRF